MEDRPIDLYIKSIEKIEKEYHKISKFIPKETESSYYFFNENQLDLINCDNNFYNLLLESDKKIDEYYELSISNLEDPCKALKLWNENQIDHATESIRRARNKLRGKLKSLELKTHLHAVRKIIEYHKPKT